MFIIKTNETTLQGDSLEHPILIKQINFIDERNLLLYRNKYQHNGCPNNGDGRDIIYKMNITKLVPNTQQFVIYNNGENVEKQSLYIVDRNGNIIQDADGNNACGSDSSIDENPIVSIFVKLSPGVYYIILDSTSDNALIKRNSELNVNYITPRPTDIVFGDPHFKREYDNNNNDKNHKHKKEDMFTPRFPLEWNEKEGKKENIFNFYTNCDFQINGKITEMKNIINNKNAQYMTGIYLSLYHQINIGLDLELVKENNSYYFEQDNKIIKPKEKNEYHHQHIILNDKKNVVDIVWNNQSQQLTITWGTIVATKNNKNKTTKERKWMNTLTLIYRGKKGKKDGNNHLDMKFKADPFLSSLSRTIHGILGFPHRRDYKDIKQEHWLYGIPGTLQDYKIIQHQNKFQKNHLFDHHFLFDVYGNDYVCNRNKGKNNNLQNEEDNENNVIIWKTWE